MRNRNSNIVRGRFSGRKDHGCQPPQRHAGGSSATMLYDAAGRRTSLTLPNGIMVGYGYDAASRLRKSERDDSESDHDFEFQYAPFFDRQATVPWYCGCPYNIVRGRDAT